MKPLLSREEARSVDTWAMETLGMPGLLLMENAGASAARVVMKSFPHGPALVLGGLGQNGGDAWVVARHLLVAGYEVEVFCTGELSRVKGDALTQLSLLRAHGARVSELRDISQMALLTTSLERAAFVVDGLFGTGLSRPVSGLPQEVITRINRSRVRVVALDLPSGVCADTGQVLGEATCAHLTCTFVAEKRGLTQQPGARHAGKVEVCDIGVRPPAEATSCRFVRDDARAVLQRRQPAAHKGDAGRVAVIAGSCGSSGAAVMASRAALRVGAGLVTVASDASTTAAICAQLPEVMTRTIAAPYDAPEVLAMLSSLGVGARDADASRGVLVLGPGFGRDAGKQALMEEMALGFDGPAVLDADALYPFAGDKLARLRKAQGPRVLTPHPGEAATLLETTAQSVQADRFAHAARLADLTQQTVVLKGAGTLVASPGEPATVSSGAHPLLAIGGSGDVLSGLIAGLVAGAAAMPAGETGQSTQSKLHAASSLAVYLQSSAAQVLGRSENFVVDRGVLPTELADIVPRVLASLLPEKVP